MDIINVFKAKCPKCKEGDVFSSKGNLLLLKSPKMNETCEKCNFKFEREPGFFFGAMFVSYALGVAEFVAFFIISYFIFNISPLYTFFGIIAVALLCSTFNFRLSRMIWMQLFVKKEQ